MSSSFDPQVTEVALRYFEGLATPLALKAALLLRHEDWDQLAACKIDPKHYADSESYWRDASAVSLLRKCKELPTTHDREAVAIENFNKCEAECFRTNRRDRKSVV